MGQYKTQECEKNKRSDKKSNQFLCFSLSFPLLQTIAGIAGTVVLKVIQ